MARRFDREKVHGHITPLRRAAFDCPSHVYGAFTGANDDAHLRRALLRSNAGGGPAFVALDCDPGEIPPFRPFQSFLEATRGNEVTDSKESSYERGVVHVG